ncbi:MAG: hypothetical protein IH916_07700 [Acidobacteria bacterium]|nr:hypothetical protein [Acidobacteriota bacterium]
MEGPPNYRAEMQGTASVLLQTVYYVYTVYIGRQILNLETRVCFGLPAAAGKLSINFSRYRYQVPCQLDPYERVLRPKRIYEAPATTTDSTKE